MTTDAAPELWATIMHSTPTGPAAPINPSIYQTIKPPIHQNINPSNHQTIKLSIHQSIKSSVHQTIKLSIYQTVKPSIHQTIKPSNHQIIKPSIDQIVNPSNHQSIKSSNYQSIKASKHQVINSSNHQSIKLSNHQSINPLKGGMSANRMCTCGAVRSFLLQYISSFFFLSFFLSLSHTSISQPVNQQLVHLSFNLSTSQSANELVHPSVYQQFSL